MGGQHLDYMELAHYPSWGSALESHITAVRRVCKYIHDHLDETIDLEDLARVAYISPFHLHRIFNRLLGENLKAYVRRLRLERSAYELKIGDKPIIQIALDAGYNAHETFTRAFRKHFGINPSIFRKKFGIDEENQGRRDCAEPLWIDTAGVEIKRLASMRFAYLRLIGPYISCLTPESPNSPWRLLVKALHMRKICLTDPKFLGICHDDPLITDGNHLRFDAAVLIPDEVNEDALIKVDHTEAGHYAIVNHRGSFHHLEDSYHFMMHHWILNSNYRLRNIPPFEIYKNSNQNSDGGIDIYIPVEPKGRKI